MSTPLPPSLADTSAWLANDRSWAETRKSLWKKLAADGLGGVERPAREIRALESYFLTGRTRVPVKWAAHEFPSVPLLFRLWFHPDRSEANWQAQMEVTRWSDYDISVTELLYLCGDNGPGVDGLEGRLYDVLFGGEPTRTFLSKDLDGRMTYTERSIERYRFVVPIADLELALRVPGKNVRLLARYAIRYWLSQPRHPQWERLLDESKSVATLHRLFHQVCFHAHPDGLKSSTPDQIELATELYEQFGQGGGSERFQREWRQYKESVPWRAAPPQRY